MDAVILARLQFAANISFHILFPSITIALGWILLYFKLRHDDLQTRSPGDMRWMAAYRFWVKVFALSFAMGVVSDQMKRAFADVQTEECDIGHDDLPSRKETAQQA